MKYTISINGSIMPVLHSMQAVLELLNKEIGNKYTLNGSANASNVMLISTADKKHIGVIFETND